MEYKNTCKVSTSGYTVEMTIGINGKEIENPKTVRLLAETLTPKPTSDESYKVVLPYFQAKVFEALSKENPTDNVELYQQDYNKDWQLVKTIKRGDLQKFAAFVVEIGSKKEAVTNLLTEYAIQRSDPSEAKRKGRKGKVSAEAINVEAFKI